MFYSKIWNNWPLSNFSAPSSKPMQISVYRSKKMAEEIWDTPSDAILWAIYTDLHGFATRGAELESGRFCFSFDFIE